MHGPLSAARFGTRGSLATGNKALNDGRKSRVHTSASATLFELENWASARYPARGFMFVRVVCAVGCPDTP